MNPALFALAALVPAMLGPPLHAAAAPSLGQHHRHPPPGARTGFAAGLPAKGLPRRLPAQAD